jgi:hypothetical protein
MEHKMCFVGEWTFVILKPGIDFARLPRAVVRARKTRSFVYALITVFVSSIEARQPLIDAVPVPQDSLN